MVIYNLKLTLKLKKDILFKNYPEFISSNINKILFNSLTLRIYHEKKSFKPYVVGSLLPIEKDKVYKKDKTYTLTIRTIDEVFCNEFVKSALNAYNLDFEVIKISFDSFKIKFVDKIITITPTVLTIDKKRYWSKEDDIFLLQDRIRENLVKKYKDFFKKDINPPEHMVNYIRILNEKPFVFNFRGGKIFANKFELGFLRDKASQTLAKLSFGVGILEKNSLGFGMVVNSKL